MVYGGRDASGSLYLGAAPAAEAGKPAAAVDRFFAMARSYNVQQREGSGYEFRRLPHRLQTVAEQETGPLLCVGTLQLFRTDPQSEPQVGEAPSRE